MDHDLPALDQIRPQVRRSHPRWLGPLALFSVMVVVGVAVAVASGTDGAGPEDQEVGTSTRVTAPPRDWDTECDNDGDHRNAPAADLPDELRLFPAYLPDGLVVESAGASVWPDHLGCHHGGVALILAERDASDPGRLVWAIQVSGPSYVKRQPTIDDSLIEQTVRVRGVEGIWRTHRYPPERNPWGGLSWTDPDGGAWTLQGARNRAEAIDVADRLRIDLDGSGPPVVLENLPGALEVLWERPEPEGAGLEEEWSWGVTLIDPEQPEQDPWMAPPGTGPAGEPGSEVPAPPTSAPYPGTLVGIGVHRMTTADPTFANLAWPVARLTVIRGREGLVQVNPDGSAGLAWDEEFGIQVTVSGSAGIDELRKVAESLELVPSNDPRLVAIERRS